MLGLDPENRNESQAQAYHFPFIYTEGAPLKSAGTHHNGAYLSPHLGTGRDPKTSPTRLMYGDGGSDHHWPHLISPQPRSFHSPKQVHAWSYWLVHLDGCKTPWLSRGPCFMIHSHGSKHGPTTCSSAPAHWGFPYIDYSPLCLTYQARLCPINYWLRELGLCPPASLKHSPTPAQSRVGSCRPSLRHP